MHKKPLMLMILDGWGIAENCASNAVTQANPANFQELINTYPHTRLNASGKEVGLPSGQMGNSEVGHLNIGAGRVVYQDITRISNAIADRSFFANQELLKAVEHAHSTGRAVHLLGLVSDGGVHSHMEHIYALLQLCRKQGVQNVFIHAFLDGRDTDPRSGSAYIRMLQEKMNELGTGRVATVQGRFYAMDRDNRWERVEKGYNAMTAARGAKAHDAVRAIEDSYAAGVTDEFVEPVVIVDDDGSPVGQIQDQDSVIFFNFRADRARQISHTFVDADFNRFTRVTHPSVYYVCMTEYDVALSAPVAFPPQNLNKTLGEVLAEEGLNQLRIAETEKYAHVTFFFNGGVEKPNQGEDRLLIPSPEVETYDLQPEMSAAKVSDTVLEQINRDYYDVIILNYANPDMVGHTGYFEAAVKAVQTVDKCMMKVIERVLLKGGTVLLTADHGNCEVMRCPETNNPFTAHTTNQVPFILVSADYQGCRLKDGAALKDIAPTMLDILGIDIPEEMTGNSIIG